MLVYRNCDKKEIKKVLTNKNFNNIGSMCEENPSKNTFKYLEDTFYMHFFKDRYSLLYLDTSTGRYICTYNIPDFILEKHFGYGFYLDLISFKTLGKIEEYAIPSNLIKFEYLESIDILTDFVDFEDVLHDEWSNFIRKIYRRK